MARSRAARALDVTVGAVGVLVSLLVGWACVLLTSLLEDVTLTVAGTIVIVLVTVVGLAMFLRRVTAHRRAWWWPWAACVASLATFYVAAAITAVRLG
ncbi:hypothetical protein [Frigoribacterium salinisoli]